ncbi:UV radiation resistance-associated gene protein isoform X1 [Neodiprion pinetum]|uniref:UV radiation resistance-associated gene protein isoform X1 n=2 Tax=Neodiprion pinetum TaxID=441929 RepID=UPI001EDF1884|nr:UV radiation resistance-associated gene protein isoform X1 [Neodiprion pinetum]XP_046490381.1 UV radiation resistance-associated gene protein isoform X1 [Neodiprion pinetum]
MQHRRCVNMMELQEARPLIRDSDLTLQPRSAPRYKVWLPLATQQLRLRNLIQVIGYNLKIENSSTDGKEWFYYTLHRTNMSSPLYTSEPIDNTCPKWAGLDVPVLHATGHSAASDIVLRLWRKTDMQGTNTDVTILACGLSLTGLVYLGTKLPSNLDSCMKDNSLIFHLQGGYFTPPCCCLNPPELKRYIAISVQAADVRDSYTVNKLCSLRSKMQALKQQSEAARALRDRIALGYESQNQVVYPQSTLNRLLQPKQANRKKRAESLRIRKELEVARFRTKLLDQERIKKVGEIRTLNQVHTSIAEENQDHGSDLMEKYRELNRDIERLREWRQSQTETREAYAYTTTRLAHRRMQLISELGLIYPISRLEDDRYMINNVHLPDSEELDSCKDTQVAVALGSVAHTTQMIANFLNIPTRYPIIHCASRSKVIDHITENIPDKDRQFPLFARGKDKLQFHYAVYLLNKNIAQLRWYCGLPTVDLRATLPNLASLISIKPNQPLDGSKRTFSGSSLDTDHSSMGKYKSLAPPQPLSTHLPVQKVVFEKCHKQSRSIGRSKSTRCSLGASLDQGLDNQAQPSTLGNNTKRICKSEDEAIDDMPLSLSKNIPTDGSGETAGPLTAKSNDTIIRSQFKQGQGPLLREAVASVVVPLESNIEITVPISVTERKSTSGSDPVENSRHRSSNSVSSCEMALCIGQLEGDEFKCDLDGDEETFLHIERMGLRDEVDVATSSANGSSTETVERHLEVNKNDVTTEREQRSATDGSKPAPAALDSCFFMDDAMDYASRVREKKQRTGSVCSFPEEYLITEKIPRRKRYDSESREEGLETQRFLENWRNSESTAHCSDEQLQQDQYNSVPTNESMVSTPPTLFKSSRNCTEPDDSRTSSEYIDSMRRSSENVFARTEALANKRTSFKVMRPRQ